MKPKGRDVPPARIDHAAALRERLGKAAYEVAADATWETASPASKELYRKVGDAVLHEVTQARRGIRGTFEVVSGYSAQRHEPFVEVAIDLSPTQISPGKAREMALILMECADAAESDAVMVEFARNKLGLDVAQATQLLGQFRAYREQSRGKAVESA